MRPIKSSVSFAIHAVLVACASSPHSLAQGTFTDPGVVVLQTLTDPTAPPGSNFGWAVSELADIDGDGVKEAIVGCLLHNSNGANSGRAYVYSGRTGALIYSWDGPGPGVVFGQSVADAGDVDGDGVHDIIVGARGGSTVAGHAYIYSGRTGQLLRTLSGLPVELFGFAVAGPGDLDGDGHADVAVSAPTTGAGVGYVAVFSGADGHQMFRVNADTAGGRFGTALAPAGDINHDGVGDLIVGGRDSGPGARGRCYVLSGVNGARLLPFLDPDPATGTDLGWFFVATVGDVNHDGFPDLYAGDFNDSAAGAVGSGSVYVWSGADGSLLRRFIGALGSGMGPGRGAGDVDGDGTPDIVAGSYTSSDGDAGAGRIDILSVASGQTLRTIISTTAGEAFGFDAVGLGDTNGDCAPDLLVSAASGNTVYIIAGVPRPVPGDVNGDRRVDTLDLGTVLSRFGQSVPPGTLGDLNGDGVVNTLDLGIELGAFGLRCG